MTTKKSRTPRRRPMVRVGLFADGLGDTVLEYRQMRELVQDALTGASIRFSELRPDDAHNASLDIYVLDFGGLSTIFGYGGEKDCFRYLNCLYRFLDDHPGCLVLLWSSFTGDIYWRSVREDLADPPANVAFMYTPTVPLLQKAPLSAKGIGPGGLRKKLRAWCGMRGETSRNGLRKALGLGKE